MTRIQFHGKPEDATAGGGGQKFEPAPRGIYTLQISDFSMGEKTSGGKYPGTPITKLVCEIADEGEHFGKRVWHNVTWIPRGNGEKPQSGHGIAVHFLHAVGMPSNGDEFDFEESEFQSRTFRALLEVEEYQSKDGKYVNQKNVIREVYTQNHPEPGDLPAPPAPKKLSSRGNPALSHATGAASQDVRRDNSNQTVPF